MILLNKVSKNGFGCVVYLKRFLNYRVMREAKILRDIYSSSKGLNA